MRTFFSKIGVFILLLIVFLVLLEVFVFPYGKNVMTIKSNLLKDKSAEILVLGNSHTFFCINPSYLKRKTINVANKSRKLETDYYLLRNNINGLENLKVVVIPISHYTLFTQEISKDEKRLYYNYYNLKEYKQNIINNSLVLNESFKELIDNSFAKTSLISDLGWRANEDEYQYDKKVIEERAGDVNKKLLRYQIIKSNKITLQKIIDLTEEHNLKLVLLLPPYHPDFYKYTNSKYDKKIKEILKVIELKSTLVLDGRLLNITNDSYFENVDHLNRKGAELFSKKMDSLLSKMSYE